MGDDDTLEEAFADMHVGAAETLAVICRHLIDQKLLDVDLVTSDLDHLQDDLLERKVGVQGRALPAILAALLRASSARPKP